MKNQENDAILFNTDQKGIALLQVNRQRARNALNWYAQERFAACIESVKVDKRIRVLIITGSGNDAFVSGADLKELLQNHDPESGQRLNRVMSLALADLRDCLKNDNAPNWRSNQGYYDVYTPTSISE
jgi:enoyl-CoA hydratase/carnithine racemase